MTNNYLHDARNFLEKAKTTFSIVEAVPQAAPLWHKQGEKHGIKYSVTLKNERGSYTFDFWGCIADAEKVALAIRAQNDGYDSAAFFAFKDFLKQNNRTIVSSFMATAQKKLENLAREIVMPNEYDVLACLMITDDTFEDFCFNFGYDDDSRLALKTYKAVVEQSNHLRRLFTHDELDALGEIN